jgi:transposase-like protein
MTLGLTFQSLLATSCTKRFHIQQGRQCTYNVTLWRAGATIVAVAKQYELHNLSVFVTLVIQHAMRMRRNILSSVASPTLQYFPTSHKWHNFLKKSY